MRGITSVPSITYQVEKEFPEKPASPENSVGINLGLEKFSTLSSGIAIGGPHFLGKGERRVKKLQEQPSRKRKGSSNRKFISISGMRGTDFNHKASTAMAKRYDTVVIEDLNIRGLQGNHHLAKGITDQGWHRFTDMLGYRLKWRGE